MERGQCVGAWPGALVVWCPRACSGRLAPRAVVRVCLRRAGSPCTYLLSPPSHTSATPPITSSCAISLSQRWLRAALARVVVAFRCACAARRRHQRHHRSRCAGCKRSQWRWRVCREGAAVATHRWQKVLRLRCSGWVVRPELPCGRIGHPARTRPVARRCAHSAKLRQAAWGQVGAGERAGHVEGATEKCSRGPTALRYLLKAGADESKTVVTACN